MTAENLSPGFTMTEFPEELEWLLPSPVHRMAGCYCEECVRVNALRAAIRAYGEQCRGEERDRIGSEAEGMTDGACSHCGAMWKEGLVVCPVM